jgi:SAM-dependent methyltransferase
MQFDQFAGDYKQVLDHSVAVSGEDSTYFAEYKARFLARILAPDFRGRVLDFGCGVGLLSGFLKKHLPAAPLDGYDLSGESVRRIDAALAREGNFTSDFGELRGLYDLIVVANVMHHIPPHQRAHTVEKLATLLAPRGCLAMFEHNPLNPLTRWAVERCPFDKDAVLLPVYEALGYLESAHLRVALRNFIVFMPRFLAWLRPLEPWLAWLPLGAQYVLVGERNG